MEGTLHIAKTLLTAAAVLGAFSSAASAGWRDFVPTPAKNGADVEVYASYERESNKVGRGGQDWSDFLIKERLTWYSDGYSFHPRFITYHLSLSGSVKQENYESSALGATGWTNKFGVEYDASVDALPEHPYTLRVFARRLEPLYKQAYATYTNNVEESYGATLRYRAKPYFFRARYIEESLDSSTNSTDSRLFSADGLYFKEFGNNYLFSLGGVYTRTDSDSTTQGSGVQDEYSLNNTIRLNRVSLESSVAGVTDRQENIPPLSSIDVDQFTWSERLHADLPWNFTTDIGYFYFTNDIAVEAAAGSPGASTDSTDRRFTVGISHSLYQSLRSQYNFLNDEVTSNLGESTSRSNNLSFDYTKSIPRGRLLASLYLNINDTKTKGLVAVPYESHPGVPVPGGTFTLNQPNADPATLLVYLKSPLPPFGLILLQETVHYTVLPLGNTYQVTAITLPPAFALPGTYEFVVSYSLVPSVFHTKTDTLGYNVGFELFNDLLYPYYSYSRTKTELISGDFPGIPPDTTLRTAGIVFRKEPFRALAEYQWQESNISPYTRWKGELWYTKDVSDTARVYAYASYVDTDYSEGTGPGAEPYRNRTTMFSGNVQKQLPEKNLYLTAGASYSYYSGTSDGYSYGGNAALQWVVSKLSVSLSASLTGAESDSATALGAYGQNRRTYQHYILSVRRKLF